jgi:hypothetical protein
VLSKNHGVAVGLTCHPQSPAACPNKDLRSSVAEEIETEVHEYHQEGGII